MVSKLDNIFYHVLQHEDCHVLKAAQKAEQGLKVSKC